MDFPKRVLVVDDEPYLRSFLKNLLEPRFAVDVAGGGRDALVRARSKPDAYVIDLVMPEMSGVEVCVALRAAGRAEPICVLTGLDEADVRPRCLAAGADFVLGKPFHPDRLIAWLTERLDA